MSDGLDLWLYFLRYAEKIDAAALPVVLNQPSIALAAKELSMLTQTEIERERYESRQKAQRDHISFLNAARRQGLEEGRAEGRAAGRAEGEAKGLAIGRIELCARILKQAQPPREQLLAMSLEEVNHLADTLEKQALGGH